MTKGRNPQYKGKVQTTSDGISENIGKITLWNNEEPTSEKSPLMTGTIEVKIPEIDATRTYRIALWKYIPRDRSMTAPEDQT